VPVEAADRGPENQRGPAAEAEVAVDSVLNQIRKLAAAAKP
jgi:hypothetical protein